MCPAAPTDVTAKVPDQRDTTDGTVAGPDAKWVHSRRK